MKNVKITKEHITLAIIFMLVLATRLFLVFPEKGLDYEAYDTLRQAGHIKETGVPLFKDPLSYSGRIFVFPPLFYYLLAGFSFLMPLELAAKLVPNIAFAMLVIVVYFIAKHLTKNKTASLITAFFSGFVPIIFYSLSQISIYSLSLPLIFFLSYTFLRIEEKGFATLSITLIILLLLTHSSVFILLISFIIYFIILRLERQEINKREIEIALFLFFLTIWFNLLLYKKAFLLHGIKFIWQNIPAPLLSSYFQDISFLGVISAVGVLSLLLGVYAIYHVFFKTKNQAATLYISFAFISFIMLWFKLMPFRAGLLFLSINLIILSAYGIKIILVSISKTKTPWLSKVIVLLLVVLFILTSIVPFVMTAKTEITKGPPLDDINALEWVKNNTRERAVVLGRVEEGFLINYVAERRNVADQNFLMINNIDQRYSDINLLFTLRLKSEAVRLLNDYKIDYIFLSTQSMKAYNMTKLFYADQDCFDLVYRKEALVYKFLRCDVE
jgi:4-amino-4-deoxy-L-arabinose transferase-like glycosyltransferase